MSCTNKTYNSNSEKAIDIKNLIGKWQTNKDLDTITLEVLDQKIIRYENNKIITYNSYKVKNDTLVLIQNGKIVEYHIFKLKKECLSFSPINPYEKDIQLMDELTFKRIEK